MRGPGRPGMAGANTVRVGRTRPPLVASRRCATASVASCPAPVTWRRSRTRRLRQESRPMQRLLLRQAAWAPKVSSAAVWA
jgi:hypothetical protein